MGLQVEKVKGILLGLAAGDRIGGPLAMALAAVNLGDDADTTGAVYGQLAGAYYGWRAIPAGWREVIAMRDLILELADRLVSRKS